VALITRGFRGRRGSPDTKLPPGQYLVTDFPVLSAGPTPKVPLDRWELSITTERGASRKWPWAEFQALPHETFTRDLHCVKKWSKLGTGWSGVSIEALLDGIDTSAQFALASSYGGYTTDLPLADLRDGKAWVVDTFEGKPLAAEHGGPARLLVPHLYLWKSAKWVRDIRLMNDDVAGFWESLGYHRYGDPWREQRYWGD
jgi:DMSO/TMAO reductase YedYZ molybdopterin-dependent catalytic subunit